MDHKDVWDAIEHFAHSHKMSCSKLARISGLDPTTFNRSKRLDKFGKPRWPSTHSIAKILLATNEPLDNFTKYIQNEDL
jgi:phage repressor protein C with HTH and peptisase S24 domain